MRAKHQPSRLPPVPRTYRLSFSEDESWITEVQEAEYQKKKEKNSKESGFPGDSGLKSARDCLPLMLSSSD